MPSLREWKRDHILKMLGLMPTGGPAEVERETFINDTEDIRRLKIREYDAWYSADSDEILNFYSKINTIDLNYEPWYWRNKRSYFWTVSASETDIKRTHSGQLRNVIDTMVGICGKPQATTVLDDLPNNKINANLKEILKASNFWHTYQQEQMPMTLAEGWGCYKIDWDTSISEHPWATYFRAEYVDYVFRGPILLSIVFESWYVDEHGTQYLILESRSRKKADLLIKTEVFKASGGDETQLEAVDISTVPQLKDVPGEVLISNYPGFLARPCSFYYDSTGDCPGRSIYAGKLDLADDLDQDLSQSSNAVRVSTPEELFNTDFLEKDPRTHLYKMPHRFDRKYTSYAGGKNADGSTNGSLPVQTTQPQVNFSSYSDNAIALLLQIISGFMSPATLGIDVAKKDNADAQREKEKVTIFSRNIVLEHEREILSNLFSELLCADEYLRAKKITTKHYDIGIKYNEFADESFEGKLKSLGDALDNDDVSPKMYLDKLYDGTLSEDDYESELAYLKERHQGNPFGGQKPPKAQDGQEGQGGSEEDPTDAIASVLGGDPGEQTPEGKE